MNLEKIIIQTLIEYQFGDNLKNGNYVTGVKKMYFGEVAATVVKKLNLQNVSKQRELLIAFCEWHDINFDYGRSFTNNVDQFIKESNL